MDLDLLKQIVDECADSLLHLQLYFQGEPLLNKDITKMVAYAHERGIYTTISTNGQVISQKLAKELVEAGLDHIIVSIDGVQQESYEKYRVGGCIDKAIHAVGLLHAAKKQARSPLKVEVQMVVFRHNEDEVPTMKHKGYEWGADLVSIKTAQIYNFEHHPESIPTNKKYSRYIVRNGKWVLKKRLRNRCWRSWSGAVMDSNGTILACCFDKCEKYAYGNVKDTRLREIWNGEKASTFRECIRKNRKGIDICNNCTE